MGLLDPFLLKRFLKNQLGVVDLPKTRHLLQIFIPPNLLICVLKVLTVEGSFYFLIF